MELNKIISEKQKSHLERLRNLHLGKKRTDETRANISQSLIGKTKGRKRPKHSAWIKENHPKGMLGRKQTEATKQKMSEQRKGKEKSFEWRKNISLSQIGEKHWHWMGGKKDEDSIIRKSFEYKEWRKSVFKRDDYTCQDCSIRGGYLEAHHIKSFTKYPDLRFEITNGITLCKKCHVKIESQRMIGNKNSIKKYA